MFAHVRASLFLLCSVRPVAHPPPPRLSVCPFALVCRCPFVLQVSLAPAAGLVGHSLDAWALLRSEGDPRKMNACLFMCHLAAKTQAWRCCGVA